jgi:NAD(P)-dependent dehydrogenase (short-subunit alcohol dehydrogenase family)
MGVVTLISLGVMDRMSKAALNMGVKTMSNKWKRSGVYCGLIHPGFVATDMTQSFKSGAKISTETSASQLFAVIEGIGASNNCKFLNIDGTEFPW